MEETPVSPAVQAVQALKDCYGAFVQKLERSKTSSVGEVVGFLFRSQGNPKVNYAVSEFDPIVTERVAALAPYQVNAALMEKAGDKAVFLHCLPADMTRP